MARSRASTANCAPGLSNRYRRFVTGLVTVREVRPMYSYFSMRDATGRDRGGCPPDGWLAGALVGRCLVGAGLGVSVPVIAFRLFPQHIFYLRCFRKVRGFFGPS